jgi:hypothetical protein
MDLSSTIYSPIDFSSEFNTPPPLPLSSDAPILPSNPKNRTSTSCAFAHYKLNVKMGPSLYNYLGYSEPSTTLNPLSKKISTFIKEQGGAWPTTRPQSSCHAAIESRSFANRFLDEENRGIDLWADPHGSKVWAGDEMEYVQI